MASIVSLARKICMAPVTSCVPSRRSWSPSATVIASATLPRPSRRRLEDLEQILLGVGHLVGNVEVLARSTKLPDSTR